MKKFLSAILLCSFILSGCEMIELDQIETGELVESADTVDTTDVNLPETTDGPIVQPPETTDAPVVQLPEATDAPAADISVDVIDAERYSRGVYPPSYMGGTGEIDPSFEPVSVVIPKITGSTPAIIDFNRKLMDKYRPNIDALEAVVSVDTNSPTTVIQDEWLYIFLTHILYMTEL